MKTKDKSARIIGMVLGGLVMASSLVWVACDDSGGNAVKEVNPTPDTGTLPDGAQIPVEAGPDSTLPDGAPSDCVMNPTTHLEIINACTDAVRITKNPTLPLLLADGGLPPLP
jgi:hypothetical protein